MKRLGPGKAGEEREVRHHDHHDKSGQPSRSLGALGLVFILGLAMGAVARGGGPSTGESAVPAATEPWTVSVEPPTASTGSCEYRVFKGEHPGCGAGGGDQRSAVQRGRQRRLRRSRPLLLGLVRVCARMARSALRCVGRISLHHEHR